VYAGSIFNEMETLEDDAAETVETALDKIRTITDKRLPIGPYKQSEMSTIDKIVSRESLLNRYDKSEKLYRNLDNRIRKPTTIIDGEDWDIVVPDNYSKIQEAVDAAGPTDGYRIFVRTGTYQENIVIGTDGIVLHGESNEDTVIDGNNKGDTISIGCNYLNISGFTIRNSGNNYAGIKLFGASGNQIQDNNIMGNSNGVSIENHSHGNNIVSNIIRENILNGVVIKDISSGNTIFDNSILGTTGNGIAIYNVSRGNIITWNTISDNMVGINCTGVSDGNLFYHNSMIENNLNAFDTSDNSWDDGEEGNYWNDYTGIDSDGDGIGDTPYLISGGDNQDRFPLMNQQLYNSCFHKKSICMENRNIKEESNNQESLITFYGNTIVVPDDYPTIQGAVDHSDDGDRIEVRPGTYYEHVIVDKQLIIMGDGSDVTFVNGNGENEHVFRVDVENVEITGFTILGCDVGFSGIRVYGDDCFIHYNIFHDCGGGVELWNSENTIIEMNTFVGNVWGSYVHISGGFYIENNTFENNTYGIELGFSYGKLVNNNIYLNELKGILCFGLVDSIILGNTISNNGNMGAQLFNSDSNLISENTCDFNDNGISVFKSVNNSFIKNNIRDYTENGLSLWHHSDSNNISENNLCMNKSKYLLLDSLIKYTFWSLFSIGPIAFLFINHPFLLNIYGHFLQLLFGYSYYSILSSNESYGIQISHSEYSEIKNNSISYNFGFYACGIQILFSNNISVLDNQIHDTLSAYISSGINSGLGCNHNIISKNHVTNTSSFITVLLVSGINTCGDENTIHKNRIENTFSNTFLAGLTYGMSIQGNMNSVCHNVITNTKKNGMLLETLDITFLFTRFLVPIDLTAAIVIAGDHNEFINNDISFVRGIRFNAGIFSIGNYTTILNNTLVDIHGRYIALGMNVDSFNNISNNHIERVRGLFTDGLSLWGNKSTIVNNTIMKIKHTGIDALDSYDNIIFCNNFIDNGDHAYDNGVNSWDNGKVGNYWDDYQGVDADGDGFGDTPYLVPGGDNKDRFPLMAPWE